jgi:hypothetical protein
MTHTLPTIVKCIREQQPEAIPRWLGIQTDPFGDGEYFDFLEDRMMSERVAISVAEAALWRAWWRGPNPYSLFCHTDDTDPLAMIRALCHARGIMLPEDATP